MKKVQEPTSRIHGQLLIGLVAAIVVMSVVVSSRAQLHHVPPAAPTFMVLHSFAGPPTDGANPYADLVRDAAGNLYGTTVVGGAYDNGVAFKLSLIGTETVLYSFTGGVDGRFPYGSLIGDAAGSLYGTTIAGGATSACNPSFGCGVVFKLSAAGTETILHTFTGGDGFYPVAGLIRDPAGNLYGSTQVGGATSTCNPPYGCGVVFKLSGTGAESVLHSFTGGADGVGPIAGLIQDAAGNFYGTAAGGGAASTCNLSYGCGVVFNLSPTGAERILYSFTGGADGASPEAGLIRDAAGNLYGTTIAGGTTTSCRQTHGCGVVFKLVPSNSGYELKVLYTFHGSSDGANPYAGLVRDAAGNLYGTTSGGGADRLGAVFELIRCGSGYDFRLLHSFTGGADGSTPYAGLTQDAAGNLYGTTYYGGTFGKGVVFRLTP
jgi:uncharacterized repeat protein (TIGR03803 family)